MSQVIHLHPKFDELQLKHGENSLRSIYGAGCTNNPKLFFMFMNPTGRNVSSSANWNGLRAPWIGTKQIWNLFVMLDLITKGTYDKTQARSPDQWTSSFAKDLYLELENASVYITNLAKCTQVDARPLSNSVFKEYLPLTLEEIEQVRPQKIISFGNQVSSIILSRKISVRKYQGSVHENLELGGLSYPLYPTFYPVGQGRRNLDLAVFRIKEIIDSNL